jgi:GAF domain-containing protein
MSLFRRRQDDHDGHLDQDEIDVLANLDRVNAVYATGLMDAEPRADIEALARQAAEALDAPIGLMTMVDADRQYFAGRFDADAATDGSSARETPLDVSYCKYVVARRAPLEITDAQRDPLVRDNPATVMDGVRSYLGVPLQAADGNVLGSFCVVDRRTRDWTKDDLRNLEGFADTAMELTSSPS